MKLFKSMKRKAGNAILPVVGTILGLTILAGSVVGVALNSSKIVYKQNNLQKQKSGKEVLYIASKYYAELLNDEVAPHTAAEEVKAIFEFLEVKKETVNSETRYLLYYPVDEDARRAAGSAEAYTGQWYRAIIQLQEKKSNDEHDKDQEVSDVLFRDAKLDELYNVGNLMSTYLIDEGLLPAREYGLYQISTIEADIDTFDEVFKYVNNSGVIEIDDIAIALYGFQDTKNSSKIVSISKDIADGEDTNGNYSIVYNLGNLGGNYYWQDDKGDTHKTWVYRQEYDAEFLVGMMEYWHPEYDLAYDTHITSTIYNTLSYSYDDEYDKHTIIAKGYSLNGENYNYTNTVTWEYNSTIEFADAMADYVFWINLDRLALKLDDVTPKIDFLATRRYLEGVQKYTISTDGTQYKNGGYWYTIQSYINQRVEYFTYKWTDDGITVYLNFASGGYWDIPLTISDVDDMIKAAGYVDANGNLSSQAIYDKLVNVESIETVIKYEKAEELLTGFTIENARTICNGGNKYKTKSNQSETFAKYHCVPYYSDEAEYECESGTNSTNLSYVYSNNDFDKAILDYLYKHLHEKYEVRREKTSNTNIKLVSKDKLISSCQYQIDGNRIKISYHFNALKEHYEKLDRVNVNGNKFWAYIYRYEYQNFYSDQTSDTLYVSLADFKKEFALDIIKYQGKEDLITVTQEEIITQETISRNVLKEELVDPIRYNYLPNTLLNKIVGGTSDTIGMKESTIALKLITKFIEINKSQFGSMESMVIKNTSIQNSNEYGGCFKYTINFKLNGSIDSSAVLYFKYMTNSARNTHNIGDDYAYTAGGLNRNIDTITKEDGTVVRKFNFVPILDKNGETLQLADLNNFAICGVMPYTEAVDESGNQIGAKVTIDGTDYTVIGKNNINTLKDVKQNILYNGDIEDLGERDFKIYIRSGYTLIINGKLNLLHNQTLELEDGAMILVNGDFMVFYEFNGKGNDATDNNGVPGYNTDNDTALAWFKQHGVNIKAGDAKIMVNGNMTYRGYKAKYSTSYNNYRYGVDLDLVFDQSIFNTPNNACNYNKNTKQYTHYTKEGRSLLSGIYIINGDVRFESWAEYSNPNASSNQKQYMYRNSYSNPLINATFYVDGTFNMEGLYMSGLYDECRANFIFAKSVVQPVIALNSTLGRWNQNSNEYGNWQDTNGYLFMIVEDAIDFSKVSFACVNLFTPYSQLLQSINEHNESATNFSDFVERDAFIKMYPDASIVNRWGLSSLLKQGFEQIYDPKDIGAITIHDHIDGEDV